MGNIVSVKCLKGYLQAQEGSTMRKDRILPALDK